MIHPRWHAFWLVLQVFLFVVSGATKDTKEQKSGANSTVKLLPENITVPTNYSLKVIEGGWLEIVVVRPSHLAFTIEPASPGNEWVLQQNSNYSIYVDIYDKERKINPSPNIAISVTFPSDLFEVIQKSRNGTFHVVRAKKTGKGLINGSLEGPLNEDGTVTKIKPNQILGQQEVTVYPELQVSPPMIFLPWDSMVKPVYTLKPVASGATGIYHWESMNPSFAALSYKSGSKNSNSPTILTTGKGASKIFAFDAQSYIFKKPVVVEISEIEDIETVPGISETFLSESIYIQLAMYGKPQGESTLRTFDNCTQIPVEVDIVEKNRFKYSPIIEEGVAIHPRACKAIRLTCTSSGPSRIWISYRNPSTGKQINTTAVISCFAPVKVEHPTTTDAVIALGTSIEVAFEGGPHKWPEKPSGYFSTLTPSDGNVFHVTPIIDPHRYRRELHVFRVSCRSLGTSDLILKVGNEPSATLRQPAVLQQNVTLTCDVPVALSVKPRPKSETKCPLNSALFKLPISFSQSSELEVNALDELGRTFYNITSLKIDWSLSDYTVAKLSAYRDYTEVVNGALGYRKWLRNVITLNPVNKEATVIVTAKASSYRMDVLASEKVTDSPYKELAEIKTEASFMLVDRPNIEPKEITLFNHEENKGVFQLTKGSGYFKLEIDPTSAAMLTYDQGQRIITAKPLRDGRTKFKVIDACVDSGVGSKEFIEGSVRVVDPTEIRYSALDKVQVGKTADIEVEVLDSTSGVIPSRYHALMNLQAEVVSSTHTITVTKIDTESTTKSIYRVTAVGLGRAQIVFKTGSVQLKIYHKVIQSNPISIEVFAPISMAPGRLNIAVSSQLEIDTTGGPLDSASIEFSSSDTEIATVSPDGLLEALSIGSIVITIKSVGLTNHIIYTQTQVDVNVIPYKSNKPKLIVPAPVEEEVPQVTVQRAPPASGFENYQSILTVICLFIAFFFTYHQWLNRRQRSPVVDHSMASPSRSFLETHSPSFLTTSQSTRTTPAILTKTKSSSSFGSTRPFNFPPSSSQGTFAACERNVLSGSSSSLGNLNSSGNSPPHSPSTSPKGIAGKPLWSKP